jgi:hypothetical protein
MAYKIAQSTSADIGNHTYEVMVKPLAFPFIWHSKLYRLSQHCLFVRNEISFYHAREIKMFVPETPINIEGPYKSL